MYRFALLFLFGILFASCGAKKNPAFATRNFETNTSTENIAPFFDVVDMAEDDTYGLTGENPIKVGENSASNQRRYIASLAGPNGEVLSFNRTGSCCAYESENAIFGSALVDVYEVTYEGLKEPILLYISFYDYETLLIPKGFTKRNP